MGERRRREICAWREEEEEEERDRRWEFLAVMRALFFFFVRFFFLDFLCVCVYFGVVGLGARFYLEGVVGGDFPLLSFVFFSFLFLFSVCYFLELVAVFKDIFCCLKDVLFEVSCRFFKISFAILRYSLPFGSCYCLYSILDFSFLDYIRHIEILVVLYECCLYKGSPFIY